MSSIEEHLEPRGRHAAPAAAGLLKVIADPSPATDGTEMLELYRKRGYPFEQAWSREQARSRAIRSLPQKVAGIEEWHFELHRTKPAWKSAYERPARLGDQDA